jgi:hypothetical protein
MPTRAYIPGQTPHADKPESHESEAEVWDGREESLGGAEDYLWGVDLFNAGFYWEAHEVWEELWKRAPSSSRSRAFLQGLIQCAAASLKAASGQWPACQTLTDKALARFSALHEPDRARYQGVDLPDFARQFRGYCDARSSETRPPPLLLNASGDAS